MAKTDASVLVLSLESFRNMERTDPASAYVLCRICMVGGMSCRDVNLGRLPYHA